MNEEKQAAATERRLEHERLAAEIDEYIYQGGAKPAALEAASETNPGRDACTFFVKTATCRFGRKCARNHCRPGCSRFLLLPNFFQHIRLDQCCGGNEYGGSELALEFDEAEMYRAFVQFFTDVVPEFQQCGALRQFRVCYNTEPHLRGNTYIEFVSERYVLYLFVFNLRVRKFSFLLETL